LFLSVLHGIERSSERLPLPAWARPALGGLALGLSGTGLILLLGPRLGTEGQGVGIFGGGYGLVQVAITDAPWLPRGWGGVELLLVLMVAKLIASSLTIGTGGSAGDFGPSLVLGGLVGGVFGRAVHIVWPELGIDAGAFALVGMGTFYGGIAHVPLSALVLVCELAGTYDLLVPLMLSVGISFVLLHRRSLYGAQVPSRRDSPAHRKTFVLDVLKGVRAREVLEERPVVRFAPDMPMSRMLQQVADARWQEVFPVVDQSGKLRGVVTTGALRQVAAEPDLAGLTIAADVMRPALTIPPDCNLREAARRLRLEEDVTGLVVQSAEGALLGILDEGDIARAYLQATSEAQGASGEISITGRFPQPPST
jgi:CIC family chloride channel protein